MDKLTLTSSMLNKPQVAKPTSETANARKSNDVNGADKASQSRPIKDEVSLSSTNILEKVSGIQSLLENVENISRTLNMSIESVDTVLNKLEEAGGTAVQIKKAFSGEVQQDNVAALEERFAALLNDIDNLAQNTGFAGENLLNGDNLVFEVGSGAGSKYVVEGFKLSSDALNLRPEQFSSASVADSAYASVTQAVDEVRVFRAQLVGDINEMNTRKAFSESTIEVLISSIQNPVEQESVSDEGAALLALQTKQMLQNSEASLAGEGQKSLLDQF